MTVATKAIDADVSEDQQARFAALAGNPYFEQVVAANRLYVTAALRDPLGTERSYWALSCLPKTHGGNRFSTLSMSTMETFVLHKPHSIGGEITGFVVVSRKVLEAASAGFPGSDLEVKPSMYVAAGDDQCSVWGSLPALTQGLAGTLGEPAPLRDAARELTARLTAGHGTNYSRYHNPHLAARVLGRT